ncbi:sigma-54 dependent transcriptional regulator [bacterium]|nr:sigma-54 dependent transcriptional regulator [bacterium]
MTGDRFHILIIDDEPAIRSGCSRSLSENGYQVTSRATGLGGLQDGLTGSFDLVLLDMKLPDLDGMSILSRLQADRPGMLVIVMTGYSTVDNAVQAMKAGAFDYLAKPFTDDELLHAVVKALDNKQLREENAFLRKQLFERYDFSNIVGENSALLDIFNRIKKVAATDSTILITGESGTGKELFAGAIHAHSPRAAKQFVTLDCSALSPSLLESELFGHMKGSFTGAVENKKGIFEIADQGTLFLDEVANLTMETQSTLLRVMECGEYKPVGANRYKMSDARIIAATNRDLSTMVADGQFREDLFYRLNVFPLQLPPLRQRKDDIPRLAYHFLRFFCRKTGKKIEGFSDEALAIMIDHPWPGNVRQLKNAVERLVIMADQDYLVKENLHDLQSTHIPEICMLPETLDALKSIKKDFLENRFAAIEKSFLLNALTKSGGNITRAAERVGMQRSNFSALMKKHRISADDRLPSSPAAEPST